MPSPVRLAESRCKHCDLPAPAGSLFCCAGCEAISRSIDGLGLGDYYRLRTQPAATAAMPAVATALEAFDTPEVTQQFVRVGADGVFETELLVEGMRCPACAWLLEHVLQRTAGVEQANVNYSSRRARVRWNAPSPGLSPLLAAIRSVGYAGWPYEAGRIALVEQRESRWLLRRLWVAGLGMMQVMMYAFPAYIAGAGEISAGIGALMRWSGLLLTLPVVAYSAGPFFSGAWRELRRGRLGMDVPVALGIAVAFAASTWATVAGSGEVYFDSITMFVFLLLGGRWLELMARRKAGIALHHLARLQPRMAQRLRFADGEATESVPATQLVPGDRVLVRTGETLPCDGELQGDGPALVSQSWLSGESRPLERHPGDALLGGSVNAGRALVMRVRRVGTQTALASIQVMMERALDERPRWAEAAQRATGWFVAAVLMAAAGAAIFWMQVDPARALWIAVSMLVVTCPCALALATPAALTVASGTLARLNVVVARPGAIERLAGVTHCVFDKTGTLTQGRPRLEATDALGDEDAARCRVLAATLARISSHPLDRALAAAAGPLDGVAATWHRNHSGDGVEAWIRQRRLRLGRAGFVAALHRLPVPQTSIDPALTVVWLGDERGWIAAFGLGDAPRPEAGAAIARLRNTGIEVHLLSGDGAAVTRNVALHYGIEHFEGEATPARKIEYVRDLQARGARVVMVGDGINDAPVLGQADVSIAMGGGADLAQLRADLVLLSDSPADLAAAVQVARRTRRVIRQNLGWALGYNAIVIPLAFAGWVTPLVAGIAMAASSLLVVANALRLRR
ncbi:MAG: heavy metal translocating P-type ATPase [Usitatibacter sp.]